MRLHWLIARVDISKSANGVRNRCVSAHSVKNAQNKLRIAIAGSKGSDWGGSRVTRHSRYMDDAFDS